MFEIPNRICSSKASYTFSMQSKIMKKYLMKNSLLLFVIYMLSSIMLVSSYDDSTWDTLLVRLISVGIFALAVFITNANIIIYYKSKQLSNPEYKNVQKKIFITGYLCTIFIIIIQHTIVYGLIKLGVPMHLPKTIEMNVGWRMLLILAYLSLIQYTFIYLMQNFTLSQYEKNRIELQLLKLKSSNAETTNQLLKQQIQPHFLFNALNTLKSLIHKDPDTAEEYLINLSDFLRASFTHDDSGMSDIASELEICSNYMEMQKIRFGNGLNYQVNVALDKIPSNALVPVFALQPLIENAIKHNIVTNADPLNIRIEHIGDYIVVTNNLQRKKSIENSTGNGLSNLKERYRVVSGEEVIVEEKNDEFSVSIKILTK